MMENKFSLERTDGAQDLLLNSMARLLARYTANEFFGNGGSNQSFESELTERVEINNLPAKIYTYQLKSCRETIKGMMIFVKGRNKNYGIVVQGIDNEPMNYLQQFIGSLKLD